MKTDGKKKIGHLLPGTENISVCLLCSHGPAFTVLQEIMRLLWLKHLRRYLKTFMDMGTPFLGIDSSGGINFSAELILGRNQVSALPGKI